MVGAAGFEPATCCSQSSCATTALRPEAVAFSVSSRERATRRIVVTKKRPLVFLHGLGGSRADWAPVVSLLPKTRKAIATDLPGAGAAEKPPKGYDPASLARWLAS